MDMNQVFRSGKYAGKTISYVYSKDKRYFNWVLENRPEMLKNHKKKQTPNPINKPYKKPTYVDPPDMPRSGTMKGISPNEAFDL